MSIFFYLIFFFYLILDSRPARKDYNKLRGDDNATKNKDNENGENLDNGPNYRNVYNVNNETQIDTDTDSSFTDLELDDEREEFTDSDYGT